MLEHIKQIVGEKNFSTHEIDLIAYGTDASQIEGKCIAVVWPQNAEQLRQIITYANRTDLQLVPRGGGTGLAGAVVPENSIVLDFSRMNKLLKFHPEENSVEVEPGIVVDELNAELEKHLVFFPVIPSSHMVAQIGGMIATNTSGNRAIKYGNMEKWVSELDVMDGTGKFFTIKQNLNEFIGKEGTTGVVLRARLKLAKPPKRTTMSMFTFTDEHNMIKKMHELKKNKYLIALEFIGKMLSSIMGKGESYLLFVEYESLDGDIVEDDEIKKTWEFRENAYPTLASNGYNIIEDPVIPAEHLEEFLKWLAEKQIPCFGHIGTGIVHPVFKTGEEVKIAEMYELVKKLNGKVTGEHGYGLRKMQFVDEKEKDTITFLKKRYDPNYIMNRGKLV
jgi:FAD/FMN-containing dehydrogenase